MIRINTIVSFDIIKIQKFHFIVLFLVTLSVSYGQPLQVYGFYRVDLQKTLALMEDEWRQKYEGLESQAKDRANMSMAEREFIFKEGGQIEVHWKVNGSTKSLEGTWELKDEDILLIKMGEQTIEYSVSTPTEGVLILKNSKGKGFFNNLYLQRSE